MGDGEVISIEAREAVQCPRRRESPERLLRTREEHLRIALAATRAGTWEHDLLNGTFTSSEACKANLGLARCAYARGDNFSRKLGTSEALFSRSIRWFVAGLSGVAAVEGGGNRNGYALLKDGTVRAWGNNDNGQLGNGWTSNQTGGGSLPQTTSAPAVHAVRTSVGVSAPGSTATE